MDDCWTDYIDKLRLLEKSVKLVSYWTKETANAAKEAADNAELAAGSVQRYLDKIREN